MFRTRRPKSSAVVLVALSVLVAGCVPPAPASKPPTPVVRPASTPVMDTTPCGAPSNDCVLPFPSEGWLVPDASTVTGVRVVVPDGAIPEAVRRQLGPGGDVAEAGIGADGFSPLAPVVLQVPDAVDPTSVPADGGELVVVWNTATGARVPIRAEVSQFLTDERGAHNVILIWPRTHFDYGARMFAAIRSGLVTPTGGCVRASSSLLRAPAITRAASAVDPGTGWSGYLAATSFVVRSEASIVGDVDRMAAIIRSDDHPVRNVEVLPSVVDGVSEVVVGQVRITDFRDRHGVIARDGSANGAPRWIDFTMTMPTTPTTDRGAPVVIYGHGLTIFKESMLFVAAQNAAKGFATIAIDMPNHGSRIGEDAGYLLDMAVPSLLGRVQSLALEGELDQLSVLEAVRTHLQWLDTSHVFYEGTSLGGFLGSTFVGLAPELDGAFVQVAGAGIIDTLFHSILWDLFKGVVPAGATTGQAHALIANAQSLLDRGDDTFYAERIRERHRPFYLVYAVGDGVVPEASTRRLIDELGLPLVLPDRSPMPSDGTGFQRIPTSELDGSLFKPLLAHTQFVHPVATAALNVWLSQRRSEILGK